EGEVEVIDNFLRKGSVGVAGKDHHLGHGQNPVGLSSVKIPARYMLCQSGFAGALRPSRPGLVSRASLSLCALGDGRSAAITSRLRLWAFCPCAALIAVKCDAKVLRIDRVRFGSSVFAVTSGSREPSSRYLNMAGVAGFEPANAGIK